MIGSDLGGFCFNILSGSQSAGIPSVVPVSSLCQLCSYWGRFLVSQGGGSGESVAET